MNSILTYFRESVDELKLVRWPTRQQAIRLATTTLIFSAVAAALFGLLDAGLSEIVKFYLSLLV